MPKKTVVVFLILLTAIGIYFVKDLNSLPTITYFPIDYGTSFTNATTHLQVNPNDSTKNYILEWDVSSTTEVPMYLRQDVSLLYANGELKGMRSKWRENTDTIEYTERLKDNQDARWDAITFHYGEIHLDNTINSVQKITADHLFVYRQNSIFKLTDSDIKSKQQKLVELETKKKLLSHWQSLLTYFKIDIQNYESIPLTDLYTIQDKPFLNMDKENSDRVIGQLWEGLYKNYIIPNIESKDSLKSFVPLILFDKKGDHLLVVYEINGRKEKLIQKLQLD
ncbi:hypothetical protein [Ornithinibacillus bavariensis]|uniref:hypothetical protein n=1 Tax=Ornithinibacillus bavariensis TaxID=545502 RepID=UPI000EEA4D63|nr:hypothetical protein [Ornithinibacillus sp.]